MNDLATHEPEISTEVAKAVAKEEASLLKDFGRRYGMRESVVLGTLKQTAFRQGKGPEVTNAQMMALLVVANQYDLNPFCKELYAFPDKGNIIPVVSIDGWLRIINSHSQFDGMDFEAGPAIELPGAKKCPESLTCIIYRKDRSHPTKATEYLDEVYRPPFNGRHGPWQTHTKRFLRHKAIIQAARIAFGFAGIYDQDEAERIAESEAAEAAQHGANIHELKDHAAGLVDSIGSKKTEAELQHYMNLNKSLITEIGAAGLADEVERINTAWQEQKERLHDFATDIVNKAIDDMGVAASLVELEALFSSAWRKIRSHQRTDLERSLIKTKDTVKAKLQEQAK